MTASVSISGERTDRAPAMADGPGLTVFFLGAGTGGHLTPGIAVAEALLDRDPRTHVLFVGSGRPVEKELLGRAGLELACVPTIGSPASLRGLARACVNGPRGLFASWRLLSARQPDVVVALGGHTAFLPALCASWRGVPVIVLEQNLLPGKVSRWAAKHAVEVVVQWAPAAKHFVHPERVSALGNPIRRDVTGRDRALSCRQFDLDPAATTLFVLGGSQGAVAVNDLVYASLSRLGSLSEPVQILHAVGQIGQADAQTAYAHAPLAVRYEPFIHDMGAAYACADLVVCRSGATTLAELTANGLPSFLIPYPYAAEDHQYFNAELLADAGAAVVRRQSELRPDSFADLLVELLTNVDRRREMAAAARSLGQPSAAEVVAERVMRHGLERRRLRGSS